MLNGIGIDGEAVNVEEAPVFILPGKHTTIGGPATGDRLHVLMRRAVGSQESTFAPHAMFERHGFSSAAKSLICAACRA